MGIQRTQAGIEENSRRESGAVWRQRQAQTRAAKQKAAALERFMASLPGDASVRQPADDVFAAATHLERVSAAFNKKLKFMVDPQSHEVLVKVIDSTTDKVIKVLPPEELQRLHRRIKETIGFLFDQRV